jgi:hypothetical protein
MLRGYHLSDAKRLASVFQIFQIVIFLHYCTSYVIRHATLKCTLGRDLQI